ncbi:hypothetical protein [Winogradskyella eximia]|jgi:hypothetical protein|uniref:hypothetical protein n=1 Tax=Winogradskyella eximia TaxID=262006 RepID=UPI000E24F01E|nr:hypothetical protein [Winogradskyella eximia]|tara:strand:- start:6447 stop:6734 length:288 start_codon:yes stop_codon:yes gene_type:complete
MYRFLAILSFYKPFVVWSLLVTVVVAFFNAQIAPAIATKLFLTVFAWYYVSETPNKRKLTFYKNIGISPLKLFSIMFIVDCFLTVIYLTIFKEFT